jgi:hypothetical protein
VFCKLHILQINKKEEGEEEERVKRREKGKK